MFRLKAKPTMRFRLIKTENLEVLAEEIPSRLLPSPENPTPEWTMYDIVSLAAETYAIQMKLAFRVKAEGKHLDHDQTRLLDGGEYEVQFIWKTIDMPEPKIERLIFRCHLELEDTEEYYTYGFKKGE